MVQRGHLPTTSYVRKPHLKARFSPLGAREVYQRGMQSGDVAQAQVDPEAQTHLEN